RNTWVAQAGVHVPGRAARPRQQAGLRLRRSCRGTGQGVLTSNARGFTAEDAESAEQRQRSILSSLCALCVLCGEISRDSSGVPGVGRLEKYLAAAVALAGSQHLRLGTAQRDRPTAARAAQAAAP